MERQLTPYASDGGDEITEYPSIPPQRTQPGQAQGVYIAVHPDALDRMVSQFTNWFANRGEVDLVDVGTSDKAGLGFILMEWIECEIDPLFLAILRDEEAVGDYTLYGRSFGRED